MSDLDIPLSFSATASEMDPSLSRSSARDLQPSQPYGDPSTASRRDGNSKLGHHDSRANAIACLPVVEHPPADNAAPQDPFAAQRETGNDPFTADNRQAIDPDRLAVDDEDAIDDTGVGSNPNSPNSPRDRRMSREWDASKVPPSQFQKRKGSILSTPGSRETHHENKDRDKAYHEKIKEKVRIVSDDESVQALTSILPGLENPRQEDLEIDLRAASHHLRCSMATRNPHVAAVR